MRLLHVYAPHAQHCDSYLVGTPTGLKAVRDAIDRALAQNYGMTEVSCNDGERYNVFVVAVVEDAVEEKLQLPYTADFAKDLREGTVKPHDTLTDKKYQELLDKQEHHG